MHKLCKGIPGAMCTYLYSQSLIRMISHTNAIDLNNWNDKDKNEDIKYVLSEWKLSFVLKMIL